PGAAVPPPSRSTQFVIVAPPVTRVSGCSVASFSVGGRTVNVLVDVTPLSVARNVTSVGVSTCPYSIGNCSQPWVPCIAIEDGTGATAGCELDNAIVAPAAGTPTVSCSATMPWAPLYTNPGVPMGISGTGVAGAEVMVNRPVVEKAVTAFVVGDES